MNKSYQQWESQFLDDMVIKFGFSGNTAIAFKQRLLSKNNPKNEKELSLTLKEDFLFSNNTLRDCWHKTIYDKLKEEHGLDYKDEKNPNAQYDRSWEAVRKWLREEIFPEYIKNIKPETTIELWQELWTQAENSPNHSLQIISKDQ